MIPVGQATSAHGYQLAGAITERTAAAVCVVSHHVVDYGQLPLATFARICRERDVPVIVDAASEYDLRGFLGLGADLALYSGHKFLGGPTSGVVAGAKHLVICRCSGSKAWVSECECLRRLCQKNLA